MAGKSPVVADEEQKRVLADLARLQDQGEADRARAILLTLAGWTSGRIAEAFGVREDTVRLWCGAFSRGGVPAPGQALGAEAGRHFIAPGIRGMSANMAVRQVPYEEELS